MQGCHVPPDIIIGDMLPNEDTWSRVTLYTQGVFKAKKERGAVR